ncbi:hypothetical protein Halru_3010 [Halovivax ruber XH-70]|uniref:Uncharacterized protein n=1 Tax=Halovivax ruber (strain DSM 18193 / JCM 13892 / XH-70) TaxID=797302 RepID=L0IH55_HALRX|nr:hypothetical protein Halru_3010 [Halovivax ruber XH-70]
MSESILPKIGLVLIFMKYWCLDMPDEMRLEDVNVDASIRKMVVQVKIAISTWSAPNERSSSPDPKTQTSSSRQRNPDSSTELSVCSPPQAPRVARCPPERAAMVPRSDHTGNTPESEAHRRSRRSFARRISSEHLAVLAIEPTEVTRPPIPENEELRRIAIRLSKPVACETFLSRRCLSEHGNQSGMLWKPRLGCPTTRGISSSRMPPRRDGDASFRV